MGTAELQGWAAHTHTHTHRGDTKRQRKYAKNLHWRAFKHIHTNQSVIFSFHTFSSQLKITSLHCSDTNERTAGSNTLCEHTHKLPNPVLVTAAPLSHITFHNH